MLPYLAFEVSTAVFAFISPKARVPAWGWTETLVPSVATWLYVVGFAVLHGSPVSNPWVRGASEGLSLVGYGLGTWALLNLRTAFSVLPEVRTLVATGPYRFVRHPMYLAYFLITAGSVVAEPSPSLLAAAAVWAGLMYARARVEERKLAANLPGYLGYAARTGALVPGLGRLMPEGNP
jgi:protein-S-isoprenylcysteine O-methyltransferase Ste14